MRTAVHKYIVHKNKLIHNYEHKAIFKLLTESYCYNYYRDIFLKVISEHLSNVKLIVEKISQRLSSINITVNIVLLKSHTTEV